MQPRETPCKVYLDFDICLEADDATWQLAWAKHVLPAIEIVECELVMNKSLNDHDTLPNMAHTVCFNQRPSGAGTKFSFHVVWSHNAFPSPAQLKDFLWDLLGSSGIDYDAKVYTKHRLFRTPWCGKGGDVTAQLLPVEISLEENGEYSMKVLADHYDEKLFRLCNHTVYHKERNICMHTRARSSPQEEKGFFVGTIPQRLSLNSCDEHGERMLAFFKPFTHAIQEMIQAHRRMIKTKLERAYNIDINASIPVATKATRFDLQPSNDNPDRSGILHYTVVGDTFCQYDVTGATQWHHPNSRMTISINLVKGTYNQLCFKCNPTGGDIQRYSIFKKNAFACSQYVYKTSPSFLELTKDGSTPLFIEYWKDNLLLNLTTHPEFFVYDEKNALWLTDDIGKKQMCGMRDEMQKTYVNYLLARSEVTLPQRLERAEKAEKKKIQREHAKIDGAQPFPGGKDSSVFCKTVKDTYTGVDTFEVNKQRHLVPLSDKTCYDILTGETIPRKKEHYFTSCLNGKLKPHNDDETKIIRAWIKDICTGDEELATYQKQVWGLSTTSYKFDRKIYINLGPEGRNGKSQLFRLQKV